MDTDSMSPNTDTQGTNTYSEEVECEGASKHGNLPNGVCALRGSEWTTDKEQATVGYAMYPDPTSNLSLHIPTPNDEPNEFDHLRAYPSPTSPFVYDDIDKLHCDYKDSIPRPSSTWGP